MRTLFMLAAVVCALNASASAQNDPDARAQEMYAEARTALSGGDHTRALRRLEDTERLLGGANAMTLAMAVRIYHARANYEEARKALSAFFEQRAHPALVKSMATYARQLDARQLEKQTAPLRARIAYYERLQEAYRREQTTYQRARLERRPGALRAYLRTYPAGQFVAEARQQIDEMEEENYAAAMAQRSLHPYRAFLEDYPNSEHRFTVARRYDRLQSIADRISELEDARDSYEVHQMYTMSGGLAILGFGLLNGFDEEMAIMGSTADMLAGVGVTAVGGLLYWRRWKMKHEIANLQREYGRVAAVLTPTYDIGQRAPGFALAVRF